MYFLNIVFIYSIYSSRAIKSINLSQTHVDPLRFSICAGEVAPGSLGLSCPVWAGEWILERRRKQGMDLLEGKSCRLCTTFVIGSIEM